MLSDYTAGASVLPPNLTDRLDPATLAELRHRSAYTGHDGEPILDADALDQLLADRLLGVSRA